MKKILTLLSDLYGYLKKKALALGQYLWQHRYEYLKKFRFTTLDQYILKTFAGAFIISLLLFVSIYQLTQIFNDLRWLPQGTKGFMLFQYYFLNAVYWVIVFQPFSLLFATVYVLSRLAQTRELVAIVSTGTSMYRITLYLIISAVAYYLFIILIYQNFLAFPAYQKKHILGQIIFQKVDKKAIDHLKDNNNFSVFGSDNLIYIIGFYNSVSKEMGNITIVQLQNSNTNSPSQQNIAQDWIKSQADQITHQRDLSYPDNIRINMRIDAERAAWSVKDKTWKFFNGTVRLVEGSGVSFNIRKFQEESFPFVKDPPYFFEKIWYPMDAMTYQEGKKFIGKLRKSKQDYKGPLASYLSKFSYSLGIIFVVLAGIGIVDLSKRKISFIFNLMTSMLVFIVYYLFFSIGISMASKGNIPAELGAYTGAIVFSILSIFMYRRVRT